MTSFLENNKDFVLKLKIQTAGQTQIRRVSLPRIADASGSISYEELVGLVLELSLPEEAPGRLSTRNYKVTLTYFDDEKDLITLASTEELVEAIELFAGQKFIRITTCVKPKITSYSSSARPPAETSQGAAKSSNANSAPEVPIQAVLESFAGILSSAVVNLQEGLAKQPTSPAKTSQSEPSPPDSFKPKATNSKGSQTKETVAAKKPFAFCKDNVAPKDPPANASDNKNSTDASSPKEAPKEKNTFIHGRHTCDGCLTTPIIGKRYHATNLPDYDLCQKCFDNYKGSEIKYEPVELRHDIPLQMHWRARQNRERNLGNARIRRQRDRQQAQSRARARAAARNARQGSKVNDTKPPVTTNPTSSPHSNPGRQDGAFNPNDFDDSLKEAIRRSLDDVAAKEAATKESNEDEKIQKANEVGDNGSKFGEPTNIEGSLKRGVGAKRGPIEKENSDAKDDIPESVEIPENSKDNVSRYMDIPESISAGANKDNAVEKPCLSLDVEEEEAMQNAMETGSVDSEKLLSESEPVQNDKGDEPKSPSSKQTGQNTSKEESFASDAVGNGDVAELMGKTLDMVAGVVSEMLDESGEMVSQVIEENVELGEIVSKFVEEAGEMAEKPKTMMLSFGEPCQGFSPKMRETGEMVNESKTMMLAFSEPCQGFSPKMRETGEIVQKSEVTDAASEDIEIVDTEPKDGAIIVDSNDDDVESGKDQEEDETDWSVVKSVGSNGTTESQQIGRAAEMLGSALFNSDMKNSSTSDSSFSLPSSVPTDLGTVNTRLEGSTKASKWATELKKLKELGFDDEEMCIEVLERVGSELPTMNLDAVVSQLLFLSS